MSAVTLFPGVAVITGAAGTGIGAATAHAFAAAGCTRIVLTDINPALLNDTVLSVQNASPDASVHSVPGDISSPDFVDTLFHSVLGTFGRVDYLVNCAGVLGSGKKSAEMSVEEFDKVNGVNYRGSWLCSRKAIGIMELQQAKSVDEMDQRRQQNGAVVNVASQLGIVGRPGAPAYCASKAALIALTRSDAIDYSEKGIRVNCVCPGVIETPMTTGDEKIKERLKSAIDIAPMKRMGMPEEVADCILFLCSEKASFIQGHAMVVDGGYVIN